MKISDLKSSGHWPTLVASFLYFDVSFMIWTLLGPLGAQIGESLRLSAEQKGMMVAVPILAGAILRLVLGVTVDRIGAKNTGVIAQLIVIGGLAYAWLVGLHGYLATLLMGLILGFAGASFAVALPQAGRWYPPNMQGMVMGLAGAGNIGSVLDALFAPRIAAALGWQNVFGLAMIPALFVLAIYVIFSREAKVEVRKKRFSDYLNLLKGEHGLPPVHAGDFAAICTAAGALLRPVGGAVADRIGGIRALYYFYIAAGAALVATALAHSLYLNLAMLVAASGALGMANGSVFQLLPQRFGKDIGVMTGLVGAGGGVGGFYLASSLGFSKGLTGSYLAGFLIFAGLCFVAIIGLGLVKTRWRTTWGAVAQARI